MPPHHKHHPPHEHGPHHHHHHHHAPPHHGPHAHHLHHWLERELGVLRELTRRDRYASIETLLEVAAKRSIADEITAHLRRLLDEYGDLAAAQALNLADAHFSAVAENRVRTRLAKQPDGAGLLFPLPPHIHQPFVDHGGDTTILIPNGHHLPHHLERADLRVVEGSRACRKAIGGGDMNLLLFEMHRSGSKVLVDAEVADVLSAVVGVSIELWAQVRPHAHPEDVEFELAMPVQLV